MTEWLVKKFIKDYKNTKQPAVRVKYALLSGIVGIISNVFLFVTKLVVGMIFQSIAVTADAVNNLTDAGSSVITLVGFKLSSKPADEEHPYGHARIEYVTGFIVSVVIILLGIELIKTSFQKILNPNPINFSYLTVAALIVSILIKLWQGLFYKNLGRRIESAALAATGQDSMNDVISTATVLVAIVFSKLTNIQIDGYMGVAVALFILYSGGQLVLETLNPLLGLAPDPTLVADIEKEILSYEGVLGIHDLMVHSYGPGKLFASVHVEVAAEGDLLASHDMIDNIEREVSDKFNLSLVIHMDPLATNDERVNELRGQVTEIIDLIDQDLSMHDFRVVYGPTHSNLIFDIVVPTKFEVSDKELKETIDREIKKIDSTFNSVITIDKNYTSSK
ncbi:MAG: cation diffusion facilitator family transporter [Acetivibrionales bacterium]|jgi:cation diffusion facilitator family transporter|nr:cation transporter [Clostridiaceae bacterium]